MRTSLPSMASADTADPASILQTCRGQPSEHSPTQHLCSALHWTSMCTQSLPKHLVSQFCTEEGKSPRTLLPVVHILTCCETYSKDMLKPTLLASNSSAAPCSRARMSSAVRLSQPGSERLCFGAAALGAAAIVSCFAHFRTLSCCIAFAVWDPCFAGLALLAALEPSLGLRGAGDWCLRFAGCGAALAGSLRFEPGPEDCF